MIDQLTKDIPSVSVYPDRTAYTKETERAWKLAVRDWLKQIKDFANAYGLSVEELKVMIEQINLAIDSMDVAITALNYQGNWTAIDEQGNPRVYSLGQSVSHNGSRWASKDNNTEEPSETAINWEKISLDAYSKSEVDNALEEKANITDVNTALTTKQDKLISGENVKTINGNNVTGAGDIVIASGTKLRFENAYFGGL